MHKHQSKASEKLAHNNTEQQDPESQDILSHRSDLRSSLRSELSSHMIRERKQTNVWDYYQLLHVLGEGSIGVVSLVKRKKGTEGGSAYHSNKGILHKFFGCCVRNNNNTPPVNNDLYAIKSIQLSLLQETYLEELRNEIEVLRSLDHPNIVKAYEVYETKRNIYVVMEYCEGGDLYSRAPYTEDQAAYLMNQLCSAIAHMHKHKVTHRDLKCENIMFESKDPLAFIKVLDFGLSRKFVPGMSELMNEGVGTLYTMSPQVLHGTYNSSADCWSMGVIAYVLLSQTKPFAAKTRSQIKSRILRCQYNFDPNKWDHISHEAKDFVASLIMFDPSKRLTTKQALNHPWLKNHNNIMKTSIHYKKQDNSVMEGVHDSIIAYGTMSELKRIASVIVAHKSTAAEIMELRKAFQSYDTEKDGVVSLDEFKAVFSNYNYTDEEMNTMFNDVDVNGCNEITFTEFIAATLSLHGRVQEKKLAEAFDLMDSDDSGYISKENLIQLLGTDVPRDRIDDLIQQADVDKDGQISFNDFLSMFREDNIKHTAISLQDSQVISEQSQSAS